MSRDGREEDPIISAIRRIVSDYADEERLNDSEYRFLLRRMFDARETIHSNLRRFADRDNRVSGRHIDSEVNRAFDIVLDDLDDPRDVPRRRSQTSYYDRGDSRDFSRDNFRSRYDRGLSRAPLTTSSRNDQQPVADNTQRRAPERRDVPEPKKETMKEEIVSVTQPTEDQEIIKFQSGLDVLNIKNVEVYNDHNIFEDILNATSDRYIFAEVHRITVVPLIGFTVQEVALMGEKMLSLISNDVHDTVSAIMHHLDSQDAKWQVLYNVFIARANQALASRWLQDIEHAEPLYVISDVNELLRMTDLLKSPSAELIEEYDDLHNSRGLSDGFDKLINHTFREIFVAMKGIYSHERPATVTAGCYPVNFLDDEDGAKLFAKYANKTTIENLFEAAHQSVERKNKSVTSSAKAGVAKLNKLFETFQEFVPMLATAENCIITNIFIPGGMQWSDFSPALTDITTPQTAIDLLIARSYEGGLPVKMMQIRNGATFNMNVGKTLDQRRVLTPA